MPNEDGTLTELERDAIELSAAKYLDAMSRMQLEMTMKLQDISRHLGSDRKQLYLSLPDGGGWLSLAAGNTTLDFWEGKVMHPNGDVTTMRSSLRVQEVDAMRSFIIVTSGQIKFSIDGGGYYTLGANERYSTGEFCFKQIYIDSTEDVYIKVMAATTPHMTVSYDRFLTEDLNTFYTPLTSSTYDADERTAQTINLDMTTYGRGQVEAFGTASTATDFNLEASHDNTHWFTIDTQKCTAYHEGFHNTARYVRLRSAVAGVAGDKVSLVLVASR